MRDAAKDVSVTVKYTFTKKNNGKVRNWNGKTCSVWTAPNSKLVSVWLLHLRCSIYCWWDFWFFLLTWIFWRLIFVYCHIVIAVGAAIFVSYKGVIESFTQHGLLICMWTHRNFSFCKWDWLACWTEQVTCPSYQSSLSFSNFKH